MGSLALYDRQRHASVTRRAKRWRGKGRFKAKRAKERLQAPRVPKDSLLGLPDCYRIKITTPQFRLAYHVDDSQRVVTLLAVSSRDDIYAMLEERLAK